MRTPLTEGSEVTVIWLSGTEPGVVERIDDAGRAVTVVTEDGTVLEFHLMASMAFVTRDRSARLGPP